MNAILPGNIVALLHSFFSNLPQEWLEGTHVIIKHLRPITSVAMLRIVFRIMGPLLPRLVNAHTLFNKVWKSNHYFLSASQQTSDKLKINFPHG